MQKIFISSIPGTRLGTTKDVIEEIAKKEDCKCAIIDLEIFLKGAYKQLFPESDGALDLQPIYNEPRDLVQESVSKAIGQVIEKLTALASVGIDTVFFFFHGVFANPITLESYAAYKASDFRLLCADDTPRFLSLVDDVYDIHATLAGSRYFTRLDNDWRNPKLDFYHLHRLLEWRKADSMVCQHLATEFGVQHQLVHQKSPADVFWRIAVQGAPSVYLSHSISQARRNWNGEESPKCPKPNDLWANDFSRDVNEVGRKLSEAGLAVQEPTCIDEYRIKKGDIETLGLSDLNTGLLPPKWKPWPMRPTLRLMVRDEDVTGEGLTAIDPTVLANTLAINPESNSWTPDFAQELEELPVSMKALAEHFEYEVLRQITARDYTLTSQCKAVVVYRPFSNPFVPEVSGGVKDEMECRLALSEARGDSTTRLFVLHPWTDEVTRRMNLMHAWDRSGGEFEKLWNTCCEGTPGKGLLEELDALIENAPYNVEGTAMHKEIRAVADKHRVQFKAKRSPSSMAGEPVTLRNAVRDTFISELAERIFDSVELFQTERILDNHIIKLYDSKEIGEQIIADIKATLAI